MPHVCEESKSGEGAECKKADTEYPLLDKVQEFCFSLSIEKEFEEFAEANYRPFEAALVGDSCNATLIADFDHPLIFHDIFQQYLDMFEARIAGFIEKLGGTMKGFQMECKKAMRSLDGFTSQQFFVEALLACTEYERFYLLMVGQARVRRLAVDPPRLRK